MSEIKRAAAWGTDLLPVATERTGPIIFFEATPTFGHIAGIIDVCLIATRASVGADGVSVREAEIVANLRCNAAAATDLRNALDQALLMLAPAEKPDPGKAN